MLTPLLRGLPALAQVQAAEPRPFTRETVDYSKPVSKREIETYRTDVDYARAGGVHPASWHRAICGRVSEAYPDAVVEYWDP